MRSFRQLLLSGLATFLSYSVHAAYVNFESSHVHPIALTPSGQRLVAVNTPAAVLELFAVQADGTLVHEASIPVGLEPVSVTVRDESEAWVANHLSDTVTLVDLHEKRPATTLRVGDSPTDIAFAQGQAFVTAFQEDAIKVFDLSDLTAPPKVVPLFGRNPRALGVSRNRRGVYAVVQNSGNQTTVVPSLTAFGLNPLACDTRPAYPPLPDGIVRNPLLTFPLDGVPKVGLMVKWNNTTSRWEDEIGQDWTQCLSTRLPDHDLFIVDASTLDVTTVEHLGTKELDRYYVANFDE